MFRMKIPGFVIAKIIYEISPIEFRQSFIPSHKRCPSLYRIASEILTICTTFEIAIAYYTRCRYDIQLLDFCLFYSIDSFSLKIKDLL